MQNYWTMPESARAAIRAHHPVGAIVIRGNRLHFHLPARIENVEKILAQQFGWAEITPARKNQAFRTTCANIRDWIASQMALVDAEMVATEEVFLPYLIVPDGRTLFYAMQEQQFLLPSFGEGKK
jgi:hypothetical protein